MKKLFFTSIAFLLLLASCKDTPKNEVTTTTVSTTAATNKANSNAVYRAIETGDVSRLDSVIDVDIIDHTDRGIVRGLDTVKKMLGNMHNHFSNLKMETIANATDGDYNLVLVRMTGTPTDNTMGMPANKAIDMMSVDVVKTNSAGKATEHWYYVDPADMMKMMGGQHPAMNMDKMHDKMMDKMAMDSMKKK